MPTKYNIQNYFWRSTLSSSKEMTIGEMTELQIKDAIKEMTDVILQRNKLNLGDTKYMGVLCSDWLEMFNLELQRRFETSQTLKVPNSTGVKLDVLFIQYNDKNGITTVKFKNGDMVMVKKAEGTTHCPYNAFTAAITKYFFGNQRSVKKVVDTTKVIKKQSKSLSSEEETGKHFNKRLDWFQKLQNK